MYVPDANVEVVESEVVDMGLEREEQAQAQAQATQSVTELLPEIPALRRPRARAAAAVRRRRAQPRLAQHRGAAAGQVRAHQDQPRLPDEEDIIRFWVSYDVVRNWRQF